MSAANHKKLQSIQNAALRVILGKRKRESVSQCLTSLHWLSIRQRITFKIITVVFKILHGIAPRPLSDLIKIRQHESFLLEVNTFFPKTNAGKRAFRYFAPRHWNCLPPHIRSLPGLESFKAQVKHYLFNCYDDFTKLYHRYDT